MVYRIKKEKSFWLDEVVDAFLEYIKDLEIPEDQVLTLAAGMTPSCPIHFGIFREIALSYFVGEELKKRGKNVRLVYYWDDFDHFCKIPYFSKRDTVKEFLGKPLCEVPDLDGTYDSYGQHYMTDFEEGLKKIGIIPDYDYQSKKYSEGYYDADIKKALAHRHDIFDIINQDKKPYSNDLLAQRESFYPLEVYCDSCHRDNVIVTDYQEDKNLIDYRCKACGHTSSYQIGSDFFGKLMWKTNWATRWNDDKVVFESSGENQLTKTGSYAVASRISEKINNRPAPFSLLYRFVGIPGIAKVSRSLGEKGLATRLTDLLEPAIIRWLFLKNTPDKSFSVDLEGNITRIYHEWDCLLQNIKEGKADELSQRIFAEATKNVEFCPISIPFRAVLVAIGLAGGDEDKARELLARIVKNSSPDLYNLAKPRLDCAKNYVFKYGNQQDSPVLLKTRNYTELKKLSPNCRKSLDLLSERIENCETETDISVLLRDIPQAVLNIYLEEDSNDAGKKLRKEFYQSLYRLLIGKECGPKLSTLLFLAETDAVNALIKGELAHERN